MNGQADAVGYRFDLDALRREYADLNGKEPSPGTERWFEAISPFLVMAYQKGLRHEPLSGAFPFLKTIQGQDSTKEVR